MRKLKTLDIFSGIGGFSLGLERTGGFETVAFCEIDHFCRAVLAKHWPDVPVFGDVRELTAEKIAAHANCGRCKERPKCNGNEAQSKFRASQRNDPNRLCVDVICGGFPCQDISVAGKGAGITGERSGLWSEYARIIGEVRPRYVIVENVAALLGRGLERVLGDLAALGFDAEWHCIPASAVGAPHRRDRIWIIAHTPVPGLEGRGESKAARQAFTIPTSLGEHTTYYASIGEGIGWENASGQWGFEPDVGRVAHGVPARVDRLRALGNAVVPQIPELIGRAIMAAQ